jgi:hypothetical protein
MEKSGRILGTKWPKIFFPENSEKIFLETLKKTFFWQKLPFLVKKLF